MKELNKFPAFVDFIKTQNTPGIRKAMLLIPITEFFNSLLRLWERFDVYYDTQEEFDRNCPIDKIALLVKWCEKYGLPFESKEAYGVYGITAVSAYDFYWNLRCFYSDFGQYKKGYFDGDRSAQEAIIKSLQSRGPKVVPILNNKGETNFVYLADDCIEAAYAQLLLLCTPEGKGSLTSCPNCGAAFVKMKGDRKYCDECQLRRPQIKRARDKAKGEGTK